MMSLGDACSIINMLELLAKLRLSDVDVETIGIDEVVYSYVLKYGGRNE